MPAPESAGHEPQRVLVVMAHPDDPEFSSGGTIAMWTGSGRQVTYVIVTDGSKGSPDREMTPERLAALRQDEQREAAAVLGVSEVVFLGFVDGEISSDLTLRHAITREIRRYKPDIVVTHDPASLYWDNYINHPDHRAAGQATLDAVFPTARDWLSAPNLLQVEGLEPHHVRQVYLTGSKEPDTWVDIEGTMGRKVEALRRHVSQIKDVDSLAERLRARARAVAQGHGMTFAEGFKCIQLR
jgi:LmbE family N-acetylglucosaminyl deacetylase